MVKKQQRVQFTNPFLDELPKILAPLTSAKGSISNSSVDVRLARPTLQLKSPVDAEKYATMSSDERELFYPTGLIASNNPYFLRYGKRPVDKDRNIRAVLMETCSYITIKGQPDEKNGIEAQDIATLLVQYIGANHETKDYRNLANWRILTNAERMVLRPASQGNVPIKVEGGGDPIKRTLDADELLVYGTGQVSSEFVNIRNPNDDDNKGDNPDDPIETRRFPRYDTLVVCSMYKEYNKPPKKTAEEKNGTNEADNDEPAPKKKKRSHTDSKHPHPKTNFDASNEPGNDADCWHSLVQTSKRERICEDGAVCSDGYVKVPSKADLAADRKAREEFFTYLEDNKYIELTKVSEDVKLASDAFFADEPSFTTLFQPSHLATDPDITTRYFADPQTYPIFNNTETAACRNLMSQLMDGEIPSPLTISQFPVLNFAVQVATHPVQFLSGAYREALHEIGRPIDASYEQNLPDIISEIIGNKAAHTILVGQVQLLIQALVINQLQRRAVYLTTKHHGVKREKKKGG